MADTTDREENHQGAILAVAIVVVILALNLILRDTWTPRMIGGTLLILLLLAFQTADAFGEAAEVAGAIVSAIAGFVVRAGLFLGAIYLLVRFVKWAWVG